MAEGFGSRQDDAIGNQTLSAPSLSLPSAGGSIRGIGEKFTANPVTGVGGLTIPIPTSRTRSDASPSLALNWQSGLGNAEFGSGWQLSVGAITRKTDKGLPRYVDDGPDQDVFVLSGVDDLVPVRDSQGELVVDTVAGFRVQRYQPRVEGGFARIERWTSSDDGDVHWRMLSAHNVLSVYGRTPEARVADPADPRRVFSWLLCQVRDDVGNGLIYDYKAEDAVGVDLTRAHEQARGGPDAAARLAGRHLKRVRYGNRTPLLDAAGRRPVDVPAAAVESASWMFEVVLDYGEHDPDEPTPHDTGDWLCRTDPVSSYRAGFEVRNYRLCRRVLLFHHFPDEPGVGADCLVRSLDLDYETDASMSLLSSATERGYLRTDSGYTSLAAPPITLGYSRPVISSEVRELDPGSLDNLPFGVDGVTYQWVDLDGEGLAGVLSEQAGEMFYKPNLGNGRLGPSVCLARRPQSDPAGAIRLLDVDGDGRLDVTRLHPPVGYFSRDGGAGDWTLFRELAGVPNLDWSGRNVEFVDLTGDGLPDILSTAEDDPTWYPSMGATGFGEPHRVVPASGEKLAARLVFADGTNTVFLADMSGDGLTDLVRVRNGEISYWPNLGYGRFGGQVVMDDAPVFDRPDRFDARNVRLVDIDGSGTVDVLYVGSDSVSYSFNQCGNGWSAVQALPGFPPVDDVSAVRAADLLGNGTACLVWSTPLPSSAQHALRYVDLMGGTKPFLLVSATNNVGGETRISYAPSTAFHLADRAAGTPWQTRLPFPVYVVERVEHVDFVSGSRFTTTYSYHHGHYDPVEREFRGFGRVDQSDSEEFGTFAGAAGQGQDATPELFQPPVTTRAWFHTGAAGSGGGILHQFRADYYDADGTALPEPALPSGLGEDEFAEALRALHGLPLRTEVYGRDGSPEQDVPYLVTEHSYQLRRLQPRTGGSHAVFQPLPMESMTRHYERDPADPRVEHTLALELDRYGNPLSSAAVAYGRLVADPDLPAQVRADQQRLHVMCSSYAYTPDIDVQAPVPAYRLRSAFDARSEELTGVAPAAAALTAAELRAALVAAQPVPFETETDGTSPRRRLIERAQTRFRDDALSPLPAGQCDTRGLLHQGYRLALTSGLVAASFGGAVGDAELTAAGYVHLDGDADWWLPSGTAVYPPDPAAHFFQPVGTADALGLTTIATMDRYDLLLEQVRVGTADWNVRTAVNDYRRLAPVLVTDPNGNREAVTFDAMGVVVATACMGKEGSADGDTLADPTSRVEYDLSSWMTRGRPVSLHSLAREQHGPGNPRWQESFVYTNGFGGIAMVKSQAHPGPVRRVDPGGTVTEVDADPRWIGSGRTVVNNKGNPVKQYEPFFSPTSDYEPEEALRAVGVTPVMYYDPIGRLVRTEHPDGTVDAVSVQPWRVTLSDANDTVLDSAWYVERGSPDPAAEPEPGDPERRAAWLAAAHARTPGVSHLDSLGRTVCIVSDYGGGVTAAMRTQLDATGARSATFDQRGRLVARGAAGLLGMPIESETAERGRTRQLSDVLGHTVRTTHEGGRTTRYEYDELHRLTAVYATEAGGAEFLQSYVVYGDAAPAAREANLLGVVHQVYDTSGRVEVPAVDFEGNPRAVVRALTADVGTLPDWTPLAAAPGYAAVQTAAAALLEAEQYATTARYDALRRLTDITLPDGSAQQVMYDEAGFVRSLQARLGPQGTFADYLRGQDYDAKGQRQFAQHGNDVVVRYRYDEHSTRLTNIVTARAGADPATAAIQNLTYTYDPVGNIVQIADAAQQQLFFANAVVPPEAKYRYDALYQLVRASGRELVAGNDSVRGRDDPPIQQLPHVNDAAAVRTYVQTYSYDELGNIASVRHAAAVGSGSWTRHYRYAYQLDPADRTNRLAATSAPGDPDAGPFSTTYDYDRYGNLTRLHLPTAGELRWDVLDHLAEVDLGGGGRAFYTYDSDGKRVRSTIVRPGGRRIDRIYLGALEVYRERQGAAEPDLERLTMRVADDTGQIAQIDVKTRDDADRDPDNPLGAALIRFRYTNLLGSAVVETDATGEVLTYEEYHPFGTTAYRSATSAPNLSLKRYRFAGQERDDETGLYNIGARYYAPWLGRWISTDPGGFGDGPNLYWYCRNNPVMRSDPAGTQSGVSITAENRRLLNPDLEAEARAYLEGVYTRRMGAEHPGERFVIDELRWARGRWNIDRWHWEAVGTDAEPGDPPDPAEPGTTAGAGGTADEPSASAGGDSGAADPAQTAQADSGTGTGASESADPHSRDPAGASEKADDAGQGTADRTGGSGGSDTASASGSADGSASGTAGATGTQAGTGTGPGRSTGSGGGAGGERSFWNRGGSTLLLGLAILAIGLLTIVTGGGMLALVTGYMAIGAGAITAVGSTVLLVASYSGHTTAREDALWQGRIHDFAMVASSPGSLLGGGIGYALGGREGMRKGALIGGLAEGVIALGVGISRAGLKPGAGLEEPLGEVGMSQWREMTRYQRKLYELGQGTVRDSVWSRIVAAGIEGNPLAKGRFLINEYAGGAWKWARLKIFWRTSNPLNVWKTWTTGLTPTAQPFWHLLRAWGFVGLEVATDPEL